MKLSPEQIAKLDGEYAGLGTRLQADLQKPGANPDAVIRDTREKFTKRADLSGRDGDDAMWAGISLDRLLK